MSNQFTDGWKISEDRIIQMYYGTKTYVEIAKMLKTRSKQAVKNRCKILGIQAVKKTWASEELTILKTNYSNNPHICELLPRWNWESIKKQANNLGLKVQYGTYKFDNEFFNNLTEKSAYVAGFIAADGYLNIKANRIEIALKATDRIHLSNIANAMKYNGPIYNKLSTNAVKLQITSTKLLEDVINILGVRNNKSLTLESANIPPTLLNHFIRGYFDGDGTIKPDKKCIRILGTEKFLEWIDEIISNTLYTNRKVPKKKGHENVYILGYYGEDMIKVCDWLYTGSSICLERKYQRYVKLSSEHNYAKCGAS